MRGVGDEAAQALFGLGADGERVVDVLQHGVEGGAQFLDLGAAVAVVVAHGQRRRVRQVVRGDGAGGVRHVAQRLQTAPQHRPAEDDERREGENEGDDLDRDQLPDRVLDVVHRRGADQDHPGLDLAGPQPVLALALEVLGAGDLRAFDGQRLGHEGEVVDVLGDVGGVLGLAEFGGSVRDVVHRVVPAVVLLALERSVVRDALGLGYLGDLQLFVELRRQVVAHVHGQGAADDGEHDERQGAEAEGQPGAEAHAAVALLEAGDHSVACRSTYPNPRTVWMRGSPVSSSLRRSRLTTSSTTLERPPKPYSHTWSRICALVRTVGDLRMR